MSDVRPVVHPVPLHFTPSAWPVTCVSALPVPGLGWHIANVLNPQEVSQLLAHGKQHCAVKVGADGIAPNYKEGDSVGSFRASSFNNELADLLWARLKALPLPTSFSSQGFSDWEGHEHWEADGVNSLFRFINYRPGQGELVAHYDGPYVESPQRKTLFTVLLYLTDNEGEGQTRFIKDEQNSLPFELRDFSDWSRCALPSEVLTGIAPRAGDALVFENRLLHDSSPVHLHEKMVVRSDIFFHKA